MVKNVISYLAQHRGLQIINVTIPFPLVSGDDDFLIPMKAALDAHRDVKLVSLDHIASYPSVILPIKKLVALAHSYGTCNNHSLTLPTSTQPLYAVVCAVLLQLMCRSIFWC
jgi:hypothetical protein